MQSDEQQEPDVTSSNAGTAAAIRPTFACAQRRPDVTSGNAPRSQGSCWCRTSTLNEGRTSRPATPAVDGVAADAEDLRSTKAGRHVRQRPANRLSSTPSAAPAQRRPDVTSGNATTEIARALFSDCRSTKAGRHVRQRPGHLHARSHGERPLNEGRTSRPATPWTPLDEGTAPAAAQRRPDVTSGNAVIWPPKAMPVLVAQRRPDVTSGNAPLDTTWELCYWAARMTHTTEILPGQMDDVAHRLDCPPYRRRRGKNVEL